MNVSEKRRVPVVDLSLLASTPRLLAQANLKPVQTDRFQPTGFPDLGPATYKAADGTDMLLVESAQSMANRAEVACWDELAGDWIGPLKGLPYVSVEVFSDDGLIGRTASVTEAHRLNSPYILNGEAGGKTFEEIFLAATGYKSGRPLDHGCLVRAVLRFDPASLLHGLFLSNVEDGRMRLTRVMSSFVEAIDVRVVASGGVKNDRVNPSGDTAKGFGNVPFARTEFTAKSITAYMNLDLQRLRSYGLAEEAYRLLLLLALYKFRRVLRDQLRFRTACDFQVVDLAVTTPARFEFPALDALEAELPQAIAASGEHFSDPRVTKLRFQSTEASSKVSRKTAKEKQKGRTS
jgi:CRISPR-associated protein Csb1